MAHIRRILATLRALFRTDGALDIARGRWYPPIAGGDGDPDPDPDPGKGGGDPDPDPGKGDPDPDPDPEKVTADDDWKAKARKHEREAKRLRKEREDFERKLKEREDAEKTEHQKALDKAREEGKREALTEAEKERRSDRLEVAVTRLAAKGITMGEGDEAKVVRFADAEDAQLHVERGIARGEIDADDIYDSEGKVNTDALTTALAEILSAKPHLAAGEGERPKPKGDADARKGDPAQKDLESMTPEQHAERKYGKAK